MLRTVDVAFFKGELYNFVCFIYKTTPTLSGLQITGDKALPTRNVWKAFTGLNTKGFLELNTIDFSYHIELINACWVLML